MLEKILQNEVIIPYKFLNNLKIDFNDTKIDLESLIRVIVREELECTKKD